MSAREQNFSSVAAVFAHHGKPLRGLMATPSSQLYQGRFGRMFRRLPHGQYGPTEKASRDALMRLGALMTADVEPPRDGPDAEESGIPSLYTYLGQFIDHDITFDPVSSLVRHKDPDALTDFRTPALDLDNVYGRGPSDQPYLYDNGPKFLLGELLDNGAPDLPRNSAKIHRALIGDPRNDENSIVSQLQCLFLRFHNRVVDENKALDFRAVQKLVRYHYQWMVVNDFLPRIVHSIVLEELKTDGVYDHEKLKFFHWKNDPFMPVEFSVAGYRLGHSMVRPGYRLNDDDATLLPIFPPAAGGEGLTGFDSMAKNRGIDWGRFIDVDVRPYGTEQEPADADTKRRLQFAYRIDTSIVGPLGTLPEAVVRDPPPSLAQRNLLRAFELGLPTGQAVARAMRVPVLDDDEIIIGKFVESPEPEDTRGSVASIPDLAPFRGNTPLWTYILAETSYHREDDVIPVREEITLDTPKLGPVGGRIVAEVFLGLLFGDNESYFTQEPDWTPTITNDFRLRDFVNYALGR